MPNFISALFRKSEPDPAVRKIPLGAPPKLERDEDVMRRYWAGESSGQLASAYGVSRERICQILRRNNVIEKRRVRRIAAEAVLSQELESQREVKRKLLADAVALVVAGKSAAEASAATGLKVQLILRSCRAQNIEMKHGRWRSFEDRKSKIREGHAAGKTLSQIVREMRAGGDAVFPGWVNQNMPELDWHGRSRRIPKPERAKPVLKLVRPIASEASLWTDAKVAELIRLWFLPTSAQQLADIFGPPFTRNSILGKLHRLRQDGKLKNF